MKRVLIFFLIVISNNLVAQSEFRVKNNALNRPDTNLLLVGIANKLIFYCKGKLDTGLVVVYEGDTLNRYSGDEYYTLRPKTKAKSNCILYRRGRYVGKLLFNAEFLQPFEFKFGNLREGIVTVPSILWNNKDGLKMYYPNDLLIHNFRVITFQGYFVHKGQKRSFKEFSRSSGRVFSPEQLSFIRKLRKGDQIVFQMAKITCSECCRAKKSVQLTYTIL